MANELLTKDDIIRGKKNFEALDLYLDGSASTHVTLPSGKKIKTRAGIENEFYEKIPDKSAAYRSVGQEDGQVMMVGAFGLGRYGTQIPVDIEESTSYAKSGFYKHGSESLETPSHAISGDVSITSAFASTYYARLFFSNAYGGRVSFQMCKDGEQGSWKDVYHEGNTKPYNTTTATSANVVVTSTGELQRSTSSRIFKTDIKDIEMPDYRVALKAVRPVSYRSTSATADRTDWSWYSFVAEDLAKIDPRLVQMSNVEFFEDTDEDGNTFINSRELPEGEYVPSGLNLNGIVTLMARINQYMLDDIEALEGEKTQLKTRMTKFEKRLEALEAAKQS